MADDDEILPIGSELSKYMTAEGFTDFESYDQFMPNADTGRNPQYIKTGTYSALKNNLDCKKENPLYISSYDQNKLLNLLDSKLLFPEDFELIDYLISKSAVSKHQTSNLWFYSSGMIAGLMSLVLCQCKHVSYFLPAVLTSGCSFLLMRNCYKYFQRTSENKSFSSAIGSLQNLCLNVHKLLRLLKETEILSTGQVTTYNVSAALYIPVKNLKELEEYPSWKTLPHLRKCLASSLLDMVDLLKSTCDEARKYVPYWLHIEGYALSNGSSLLNYHNVNDLLSTEGYVSLKDLQIVNDYYLILQSELLKWVGLGICPGIWNVSDANYKSNRTKIINLFYSSHSKLSVISFKLKMHYDIQKVFLQCKGQRLLRSNVIELSHMQSELHNLFLLILSMLLNLKNLEDQMENNSNNDRKTDLNILRKTIGEQLKNIRDDLTSAVNAFNTICSHSFAINKPNCIQSDKLEKNRLDNPILESQLNLPEGSANKSDCHINSSDEVFLAITDSILDEQEKHIDNWDIESNSQIPKTLLSELSTTLKPIKENFKEREKAALERVGLVDIFNESDSENENIIKIHSSANSVSEIKKNELKKRVKNDRSFHSTKEEDSRSDTSLSSNEDSVNNHTHTLGFNPIQGETIEKVSSERLVTPTIGLPVLNDKSVASLIAMKSQSWGLAEEECYSDD